MKNIIRFILSILVCISCSDQDPQEVLKSYILAHNAYDIEKALNSNLRLDSITSKGDTVYCLVVENTNWLGSLDITDLVHDPTVFVINEGKIKVIIGYPSEKTGKKIETAIGELYQWSEKFQDSTIYDLIHPGQFVYSTEAAEIWLDLF